MIRYRRKYFLKATLYKNCRNFFYGCERRNTSAVASLSQTPSVFHYEHCTKILANRSQILVNHDIFNVATGRIPTKRTRTKRETPVLAEDKQVNMVTIKDVVTEHHTNQWGQPATPTGAHVIQYISTANHATKDITKFNVQTITVNTFHFIESNTPK